MTKDRLNIKYFEWMYDLVCYDKTVTYYELFHILHNTEFVYSMEMDGNRFEDGVDLRYRFGREKRYKDSVISSYLDNGPCSVLEMLVALVVRCEEHVTDDPEFGNRTGKWFWVMIDNLGLGLMSDIRFTKNHEFHANDIISRFLNREYEPNGKGGLFTVKYPHSDMRTVEIWYQMCWYLNEVL